jgi:hypothetical protein
MHFVRVISAVALLGSVVGCYPRTQTQYSPDVAERPQSVQFFQGTLIDRRPATFQYGTFAGVGAALVPTNPYFAGLAAGGRGSTAGIGAAFGGVAVLAGGTVPNLPATEFTVCLDRGTYPLSPGAPAAIIVVQNDYPYSYDLPDSKPDDLDMTPPTPVLVRVVGSSGRVMRTNPLVLPRAPTNLPCFAAASPMSVPLGGQPVSYPLSVAQNYGYQQYYRHHTIEP